MNILVTAGNTLTPIDHVRGITNIFTGRTGARIALYAYERGHSATLLTSHREVIAGLDGGRTPTGDRWTVRYYRTFDDLHQRMAETVQSGGFAAIIHSAAVSDYCSTGVFAPAAGTRFVDTNRWV